MAKLLGPFSVSFGDLQIPRAENGGSQPPLIRVYYPCVNGGSSRKSSWLPSVRYAFGYLCNMTRPSNFMRRSLVWVFACMMYMLLWPGMSIAASISKPLVMEEDNEERFPVVVFSHGLWACRTTYSTFCSDLASYGYIVVAPEHLDGSANVACYIDNGGETRWVEHKYRNESMQDMTFEQRAQQLKERVKEVEVVVDTVDGLNRGSVKSNLVSGETALDVKMFKGRLDLERLALAGHSFGGATAVIAPAVDRRIKCCLGLDVWWEPVEKVDYEKVSGKVPVLLVNTEKFDWKTLKEARLVYLNARAGAKKDGEPLETKLVTIKRTRHQDQSDFPVFLPWMSKKLKLSGDLDVQLAKDINSRVCLEFLQKKMLVPGRKYPSFFHSVDSDNDFIIHVTI